MPGSPRGSGPIRSTSSTTRSRWNHRSSRRCRRSTTTRRPPDHPASGERLPLPGGRPEHHRQRSLRMLSFIARRVGSGIAVLLAVSVLTFVLLYFSSGSIARNILGDQATAAQVAAKEAELGLDRPLLTRLLDWLGGAVRGDFGRSWFNREPVVDAVLNRLPVTLALVVVSILLIAVVST